MAPNPEAHEDREAALAQIAALALAHNLSLDEIGAHLRRKESPAAERSGSTLNRLFMYLGGAFVFAGIGLLISFIWDDIGSAQRVIVTLGSGIVAFALGIFSARDPRLEKGATPLFIMSALLQPTGLFVFLDEYVTPTGDLFWPTTGVFSFMAIQQAMAFFTLRRTALLFFSYIFFFGALVPWLGRLEIDDDIAALVCGISMLCLATWADRSPHRAIAPFWYFFGSVFLLSGTSQFFYGNPIPFYLGVNAFLVYLSLRLSSRTILFVGIAGLLCYLSWYAWEYFANSPAWPVAMILLGFLFLGTGRFALSLSRKIASQKT